MPADKDAPSPQQSSDQSALSASLSKLNDQLNLTRRFESVPAATIDNLHSTPTAINAQSIKVLSWNINKNNNKPDWIADFSEIIQRYRPDKIFLQEVLLCATSEEIPQLVQMGWSFAPNFIDKISNTYSGVLIATRDNHLNAKAVITQHSEPITNTPKVSLFAEYSLADSDEILLAVNTHLINFVDLSKFQSQLEEVEAVLAAHAGRIIFSGDFNTWNQARWKMLYQMTTRLGLKAVSFSEADTKKIKSFLLSPPLDYIFYRGLYQKPLSAKVLDQFSSSDHNPLLVELCSSPLLDTRAQQIQRLLRNPYESLRRAQRNRSRSPYKPTSSTTTKSATPSKTPL